MNNVIIRSPWITKKLSLRPGKSVQISIVTYEHAAGIPARFCAGLIPAAGVSKQLLSLGFESVVRVIDPTSIANYCNGWQENQSQFRDVITKFLWDSNVAFFFDEAERVSNGAIDVLSSLGSELEVSRDRKVADIVRSIKESGKRHSGDSGFNNATLYMAAHPFSWLDMHHPLIWKKSYSPTEYHFVNLMSVAEERFIVVRRFLQERRPDLSSNINPIDRFTTLCHIPCYIPVAGEPTFADLVDRGYSWCHNRYSQLATESSNHVYAHKDFKALMSFLRLNGT